MKRISLQIIILILICVLFINHCSVLDVLDSEPEPPPPLMDFLVGSYLTPDVNIEFEDGYLELEIDSSTILSLNSDLTFDLVFKGRIIEWDSIVIINQTGSYQVSESKYTEGFIPNYEGNIMFYPNDGNSWGDYFF